MLLKFTFVVIGVDKYVGQHMVKHFSTAVNNAVHYIRRDLSAERNTADALYQALLRDVQWSEGLLHRREFELYDAAAFGHGTSALHFQRTAPHSEVLQQRQGHSLQDVHREISGVVRDSREDDIYLRLAEQRDRNDAFDEPSDAARCAAVVSDLLTGAGTATAASLKQSRLETKCCSRFIDLNVAACKSCNNKNELKTMATGCIIGVYMHSPSVNFSIKRRKLASKSCKPGASSFDRICSIFRG